MTSISTAALYRWGDLVTDRPMPMLERRRIIGEQAMLSQITLEQGCVVPTHTHVNEQFAIVVTGRMRFGIGGEADDDQRELIVGPGEVLYVPSNVPHSAEALETSVVLDIFSPTSEKTGVDRD